MISGGAVIHVKVVHDVDPYLEIPMPIWMKGWWKKWFYLRNDASAPLPTFTSGRPIPLHSMGDEWLGRTSSSCNPCVRTFSSCARRG
jgi:hypothetical protein